MDELELPPRANRTRLLVVLVDGSLDLAWIVSATPIKIIVIRWVLEEGLARDAPCDPIFAVAVGPVDLPFVSTAEIVEVSVDVLLRRHVELELKLFFGD